MTGKEQGREGYRNRDTAMAMALILILLQHARHDVRFSFAAAVVLVLAMTWPGAFAPLARAWFGLSRLMGTAMSRLLLSVVFCLVVTPVGILRRISGKDPLREREWKKGAGSAFVAMERRIDAGDIERPF